MRYGNYPLDSLGSIAGSSRKNTDNMKCFINNTFRPYIIAAAEDKPICNKVPLSQHNNPCDSVYGTKEELENWKTLAETSNFIRFINICLIIDENNNSKEYLPWLVDKKYTDTDIYALLNITAEEQNLIEDTVKRFSKNSDFGKNYYKI